MDNIIRFYPNDEKLSMYDLGLILEAYLKQINNENEELANFFLKIINEAEEECIKQGLIKKYDVSINKIENMGRIYYNNQKELHLVIDMKSGKYFMEYFLELSNMEIKKDFFIDKYPYSQKGKISIYQKTKTDICESGKIKNIYKEAFENYEEEFCKKIANALAKIGNNFKLNSCKKERITKYGKKAYDTLTFSIESYDIYPLKYKFTIYINGNGVEDGFLDEKNSIKSQVYIKKYDFNINQMPKFLLDYIKHYFILGYELESGQIVKDKPNDNAKLVYYLDNNTYKLISNTSFDIKRSLLESLKIFLLRFKKTTKEEDIIDVEVKETPVIEDKTLHSNATRESIKEILLNLSKNNKEINCNQKIRLSNEIFFYTEDNIKKVDKFFLDKNIIKYCDLSLIDFTNASIEGVDLSYTGAHIILKDLYNKSIKDANLRGINLSNQDLNDILATNADLRDTYVFVEIDKSAIKNTKFSSTSTFCLNGFTIDCETARLMGLNIENTKNLERTRIKLTY